MKPRARSHPWIMLGPSLAGTTAPLADGTTLASQWSWKPCWFHDGPSTRNATMRSMPTSSRLHTTAQSCTPGAPSRACSMISGVVLVPPTLITLSARP